MLIKSLIAFAIGGFLCVIALEVSVSFLPYEDGTFMQVSGMKFEVDASVPSPVVLDEVELFSHVADAPRRVGGLQILDKESGEYLPVDLDKRYTLASFSYLLKDLGGFGIFRGSFAAAGHKQQCRQQHGSDMFAVFHMYSSSDIVFFYPIQKL